MPNIPIRYIIAAVGGLAALISLGWLIHSRNSWRDTAQTNEKLYQAEQTAHRATIANYRAAAVQARALDQQNVARVEQTAATINQRTTSEYEARIADARARSQRLQPHTGTAPAHLGGSGNADLSTLSVATRVLNDPATEDQLSGGDALTATEQAIQLDELQKWVGSVVGINTNSSPTKP